MTVTDPSRERERARRVSDLWQRRPGVAREDIEAEVDEQLAVEEAERARATAEAEALTASFVAMQTCVCGAQGVGRDGWCERCSRVNALLEAEQAATELVAGGQLRRDVVHAARLARAGVRS
jgi:hypothetical protein